MTTHTAALARLAGAAPGATASTGYKPPRAPAHVYLLAEHLDTVLAAGEDLLAVSFIWNAPEREAEAAARARVAQREGLELIRSLEMTLVTRVLRAREHASRIAKEDAGFRLIASLFVSATTVVADAVPALCDPAGDHFQSGAAATAYLRSRGLIESDAAAPIEGAEVRVTEEFLVARVVPLLFLLDMAAQFLDTLDVRYDLFPEKQPSVPAATGEAVEPESLRA